METVGNFQWKAEESENTPLLNLTIKNISENKTILILDVVWATGREDFLKEVYTAAIENLEGADNCCLGKEKVCLVEDI
jgi:hypothetical protein